MNLKLTKKENNKPSSDELFSEGSFEVELRGDVRAVLEFNYQGHEYLLKAANFIFDKEEMFLEGALESPSSFFGRFLFAIEYVRT